MKNWLVCLLVICLLGIVTSAAEAGKGNDKAKKPKQSPAERYKKLDKDGNGSVTVEEFSANTKGKKSEKASLAFKKKDKNTDGSLTFEEFKHREKKQNKKKNA